jgi:hypothetical protein
MLTQAAPALVNALSGSLPDNAVRALMQAIGNCTQPLSHRGAVNLGPRSPGETGPGSWGGGAWNPFDYPDLMPDSSAAHGRPDMVDVPGWGSPGGWGSTNYGGDTFNFPINQNFSLNNFYGGPSVYNAGDQFTNNSYTTNQKVTNQIDARRINVQVINGRPVRGDAGPQGVAGVAGEAGEDGGFGGVNVRYAVVGPYLRPQPGPDTVTVLRDVSLGGVIDIEYVKDVTWDPEICDIVKTFDTVGIPTTIRKTPQRVAKGGNKTGGPQRVVDRVV